MGHIAHGHVSSQWNKNSEEELLSSALKAVKEIMKCANTFKGVEASYLGISKIEKKDNNGKLLYLEFHFEIALEKRGSRVIWNLVFNAIKRIKPCRFTRSKKNGVAHQFNH